MASKPKITVLVYTARDDFPYEGRPDRHCFEPTLKTLAKQSFTDFEVVLVDMLWEKRPNWFEAHPQPFPIKHVPSSPNFWQNRGRTGLCAQINRGFAWADGELIWMAGENNMFPKRFLETAWNMYRQKMVPVAWYAICGNEPGEPHADFPQIEFDLLGYTPQHIRQVDHRAKPFAVDPNLETSPCHHQNYFGYSSVPLETAFQINGFDELFDGQWGLFDCDFGSRLDLAGCKMTHARDLFVVEPPVIIGDGYSGGVSHKTSFKCHYAIYLHNRATKRRVNTPLQPTYVDQVKRIACFDQCAIKGKCSTGDPTVGERVYYPFCEGETRDLAQELFRSPPIRNLRNDRAKRLLGHPPFDRGFFST